MRTSRPKSVLSAVLMSAALAVSHATPASAQITFNLAFNDPGATYAAYYDPIRSNLLAAASDWSSYLLSTTPSSLEIEVGFLTGIPRATGRSFTSFFVGNFGGIDTYEQGAAGEIRTGIDPNGAAGDIEINLNPDYLADELWFDPDPEARAAAVPIDRTDAVTVFLHELGHAFSFNGWRDGTTGALPDSYQSTFDAHVSLSGDTLFFNGSNALSVYGAPVPITFGNYAHVGNDAPRLGADLIPDLMNGVVFYRGERYGISLLDLAITEDAGLRTRTFAAIPEPGTLALLGTAVLPLAGVVVRRRRNA